MIRSTLKRAVKRALGIDAPPPVTTPPRRAEDGGLPSREAAPEVGPPEPQAAAAQSRATEAAGASEPEPQAAETRATEAADANQPEPQATEAQAQAPAGDLPPITPEAVQEILDDMVRPALQMDGGDITLVKVENNDIYVRLVGACSSCPSSIMTMKMGVEALFREEFPQMGQLIQVD